MFARPCTRYVRTLLALVVAICSLWATAEPGEQAIERLLNHQFAKPDSSVVVLALAVAPPYALVDWQQDSRAGRALLQQEQAQWRVVLCGGQGLRDVAALADYGIDPALARRLVRKLNQAEGSLNGRLRQQLDAFSMPARADEGETTPLHQGVHSH